MSGVTPAGGITLIEPGWIASGSDYVTALAWSPDGRSLAAAFADGPVHVIDPETGRRLQQFGGHRDGTLVLGWSPDGRRLASGGQDGKLRLWAAAEGLELATLESGGPWVEHLAWAPKGDRLASTAGKVLRIWKDESTPLFSFEGHASTISGLAWLADGHHLATACYGGVSLWRLGQERPERRFEWKGSLVALALSPNCRQIAGGCQDASMLVWNVRSGKSVGMSGYPGKVSRLAWDTRSRFLASAAGHQAIVWDFAGPGPSGRSPLVLDRHLDRLGDLRFHPRQPWLATAGIEGMLILWRLPEASISHMAMAEGPLSVLAWHPEGKALAAGSADGTIVLYKLP